jgi:DNA-directed RNA polymerase specialized sigma24 family protein
MRNLTEWWSTFLATVDYRKWILRAIRARARLRKEDEEEILIEVLKRAAVAASQNRLPEWVGPWLSRTASFVLFEYRRQQFRQGKGLEGMAEIADTGPSVEEQTIENEAWQRIEAEFERWPPKLQEPYRLVRLEGYSPSEVCRRLGCGRTTLWENLREADKRLHLPLSKALIEGTVVNAKGQLEKAARVELRSALLSKPMVQSGGAFFFQWLRPACYQLVASVPHGREHFVEIDAHAGENSSTLVLGSEPVDHFEDANRE